MFIFSSAMCFVRYNLEAVLFQTLTIFLLNKERGLNGFYQTIAYQTFLSSLRSM